MIRPRFVLLAGLLAALSGCGGPSVPAAQNYATIHGRAFDTASNQPIANVVVTVDTILTATTASDGTYRIANVPLGQYDFVPQAPSGYTAPDQPTYHGSVAAGENITVDVPLTKS